MPTVLLVDVSLSMSRGEEEDEDKEGGEEGPLLRRDLAALGCNIILDHFIQHCKLEFVSLVSVFHDYGLPVGAEIGSWGISLD